MKANTVRSISFVFILLFTSLPFLASAFSIVTELETETGIPVLPVRPVIDEEKGWPTSKIKTDCYPDKNIWLLRTELFRKNEEEITAEWPPIRY